MWQECLGAHEARFFHSACAAETSRCGCGPLYIKQPESCRCLTSGSHGVLCLSQVGPRISRSHEILCNKHIGRHEDVDAALPPTKKNTITPAKNRQLFPKQHTDGLLSFGQNPI